MKITFNREKMLNACKLASLALPRKEVKPILRHILLSVDEVSTVQATDMEMSIAIRLGGIKINTSGDALLPAAFLKALGECVDEEMTVETDEKRIALKGERAKFQFPVEDAGPFPRAAEMADGGCTVTGMAFGELSSKVTFAASCFDAIKFGATSGVLIEGGEKLSFVATDGHCLSKYTATCEGVIGEGVCPTRAIRVVERAASESGDGVRIFLTPETASFRTGDVTVSTQLIAGRFPKYRNFMPKKGTFNLTLPVGPTLLTVKQAAIMLDDESKRLVFDFDEFGLKVSAANVNAGEACATMPMQIETMSGITQWFLAKVIIDCLSRLPADATVQWEATTHDKPVNIIHGDWQYVAVPMFEKGEK